MRRRRILIAMGAVLFIAFLVFAISIIVMLSPAAPTPKDGVIRVACVGDSITQGIGVADREQNAYPAQLQRLLGDEYQVLNYGLGARSLQSKALLSYTKEKFYALSQQADPDIVVIMLGTNDTMAMNWNADRYESDLEAFLRTYKGLDSEPIVYVMKCPPIYKTRGLHREDVMAGEVLPIIERVAAKVYVPVIDVYTALSGHEDLFDDGLHPNAEGATIIAETVFDVISGAAVE